MARKNKVAESVDSSVPMKERLQKTITSVESQLHSSRATRTSAQKNEKEWNQRVLYAQDMIAGTDDPDALEALGILKAQAEEYHALYSGTSNEDNEYIASLESQLAKLKATLSSLDLIEKKRELNEHLRSISSGTAIPGSTKALAQTSGTAESREIDSLIHTAKALIELKSDKTT